MRVGPLNNVLACSLQCDTLCGKPDAECRAFADSLALGLHGAAVHFDQVTHDGQPEPQTAVLTRVRTVCLPELVEHVGQEFRMDSSTVVGNCDLKAALNRLQAL